MTAPLCQIIIYRGDDTLRLAYVDVTMALTEGGYPVISKAENRPGSASFSLANPQDGPTYTSLEYNAWEFSDGTPRPIMPGMYCELIDIAYSDDGATATSTVVMAGYITTIQPGDTTTVFEIGDGLTFLGKTGSWLRRNYRSTESRPATVYYDCTETEQGGFTCAITPPEGMGATATPSAVYLLNSEDVDVSISATGKGTYTNSTHRMARAITVELDATMYVENTVGYSVSTLRNMLTWTITLSKGNEVVFSETVSRTYRGRVSQRRETVTIYPRITIADNDVLKVSVTYSESVVDSRPTGTVVTPYTNYRSMKFTLDTPQRAESMVQDGVFTSTSAAPSDLVSRVYAVFQSALISVPDIMSMIAEAVGYQTSVVDAMTPRKALAYYRVGGSYALGYLQKLADQKTSDGSSVSFVIGGTRTNQRLMVGRRYNITDDAVYLIKYAGDTIESTTLPVLDISEFNPKMTLKSRPNLVTLNATMSDNTSLCVVFEDTLSTDLRGGLTIESLRTDSGVTDLGGAVNSAYGDLTANSLDDWEGTVTVPGIVVGMMSETDPAHIGSGVPVEIIDSRYGFDEDNKLKSRVKQVSYDYNRCVTILTIGNYDMQYSSAISDSNALVVNVRDMVTGISGTKLDDQQFCYIRDLTKSLNGYTDLSISLHATTGQTFTLVNKAFQLPADASGEKHTVIMGQAQATVGSGYLADDVAYGIDRIDVTAESESPHEDPATFSVDVPPSRRPDFHLGQSLTVCLMVRTL